MTSNLPIEYFDIIIIGGGYSGLSAALESSRSGFKVCVLEAQPNIGGLAEIFQFDDGIRAEKYYHHWFNNDESVLSLVKDEYPHLNFHQNLISNVEGLAQVDDSETVGLLKKTMTGI